MPLPSTRQARMEVFMGKMPGVDDNHYIDNIAFRANVLTKTADYTVLASESGSIFTNYGTTGTIDFTLPAPAAGLNYWFYSADGGTMLVVGATNLSVAFNDVTATSVQLATENEIIGGAFHAVSDGTKWFFLPYLEESQTVTVA